MIRTWFNEHEVRLTKNNVTLYKKLSQIHNISVSVYEIITNIYRILAVLHDA